MGLLSLISDIKGKKVDLSEAKRAGTRILSPFERFPNELLIDIAEYLYPHDPNDLSLLTFRQLNRCCRDVSHDLFGRAFFTRRRHAYSLPGLRSLVDISANADLKRYVQSVEIGTIWMRPRQEWKRSSTLAEKKQWASRRKQYVILTEQETLLRHNHDLRLLRIALNNLKHQNIAIGVCPKMDTRWPEDTQIETHVFEAYEGTRRSIIGSIDGPVLQWRHYDTLRRLLMALGQANIRVEHFMLHTMSDVIMCEPQSLSEDELKAFRAMREHLTAVTVGPNTVMFGAGFPLWFKQGDIPTPINERATAWRRPNPFVHLQRLCLRRYEGDPYYFVDKSFTLSSHELLGPNCIIRELCLEGQVLQAKRWAGAESAIDQRLRRSMPHIRKLTLRRCVLRQCGLPHPDEEFKILTDMPELDELELEDIVHRGFTRQQEKVITRLYSGRHVFTERNSIRACWKYLASVWENPPDPRSSDEFNWTTSRSVHGLVTFTSSSGNVPLSHDLSRVESML